MNARSLLLLAVLFLRCERVDSYVVMYARDGTSCRQLTQNPRYRPPMPSDLAILTNASAVPLYRLVPFWICSRVLIRDSGYSRLRMYSPLTSDNGKYLRLSIIESSITWISSTSKFIFVRSSNFYKCFFFLIYDQI